MLFAKSINSFDSNLIVIKNLPLEMYSSRLNSSIKQKTGKFSKLIKVFEKAIINKNYHMIIYIAKLQFLLLF